MNSIVISYDKIPNSKTREYFKEVVSSYNNGNYRSAIVMLYTVAICDILFKLKDLYELYGDTTAKLLLDEYESRRHEREKQDSKSSWEYELIKEAHKKSLIDSISFSELETVYTYRNMSAHPILDSSYELCSPSQETTIALIRAIFDRLLTQPPLYIGKIIDSMTEDLKARKQILLSDKVLLRSMINDKYISHLNERYIIKVFCAFWKFCFMEDDEICNENRDINIEILHILLDKNYEELKRAIIDDSVHYNCSINDDILLSLYVFLSEYVELYALLRQETKTALNSLLQRNTDLIYISWFMYDNLDDFVAKLKDKNCYYPSSKFITKMVLQFNVNGKSELFYDYLIECYSRSYCFEIARNRWNDLIAPQVDNLSRKQIIRLIDVTNNNDQIYYSYHAYNANCQIVRRFVKLGLDDFNFDNYHHFDFDKSLIEQ